MLAQQRNTLIAAFEAAAAAALNQPFEGVVTLEKPKDASHGDVACNLAMQMAKPARRNPRELAQLLAEHVSGGGSVILTTHHPLAVSCELHKLNLDDLRRQS